MSAAETITRTCPGCGVPFGQPNDPGRKRVYCDDACKQRVYRAKRGVTGHAARDARTADKARQAQEQERKRQQHRADDARRARERRDAMRDATMRSVPGWLQPHAQDSDSEARARMRCAKLYERGTHHGTTKHEREACLERVETIRAKHGW